MKWTKLFLSRCATVLDRIIQTKPSCLAKRLKNRQWKDWCSSDAHTQPAASNLAKYKKGINNTDLMFNFISKQAIEPLDQWIIVMFLLSRFSHKLAIQLGSG
jgi:hypothetical protein